MRFLLNARLTLGQDNPTEKRSNKDVVDDLIHEVGEAFEARGWSPELFHAFGCSLLARSLAADVLSQGKTTLTQERLDQVLADIIYLADEHIHDVTQDTGKVGEIFRKRANVN